MSTVIATLLLLAGSGLFWAAAFHALDGNPRHGDGLVPAGFVLCAAGVILALATGALS